MSIYSKHITGFIELRRLYRDNAISCTPGETPWFFSAGREFGLWSMSIHAFGLRFGIIGPFRFVRS